MADYFNAEHLSAGSGAQISLRAQMAMEVIKHCALVMGKVDGEDSAGRSRIAMMPSADVAKRANEIADALVNDWESRGWVRKASMSEEDAAAYVGQLERIKSREAYKTVREELTGKKED